MPTEEYTALVFMLDGKYCRFGSYNTISFVENPLGATLYVSRKAAEKRGSLTHYKGPHGYGGVVPPGRLQMVKITTEIVT